MLLFKHELNLKYFSTLNCTKIRIDLYCMWFPIEFHFLQDQSANISPLPKPKTAGPGKTKSIKKWINMNNIHFGRLLNPICPFLHTRTFTERIDHFCNGFYSDPFALSPTLRFFSVLFKVRYTLQIADDLQKKNNINRDIRRYHYRTLADRAGLH